MGFPHFKQFGLIFSHLCPLFSREGQDKAVEEDMCGRGQDTTQINWGWEAKEMEVDE